MCWAGAVIRGPGGMQRLVVQAGEKGGGQLLCFISISMKWAPASPARRLRCAGFLPATSSAASRISSRVSAGWEGA